VRSSGWVRAGASWGAVALWAAATPELRADTYGQVVLPFEAATVLSPLAQIVNVPAAVATYV
jgi:hypothetical protein